MLMINVLLWMFCQDCLEYGFPIVFVCLIRSLKFNQNLWSLNRIFSSGVLRLSSCPICGGLQLRCLSFWAVLVVSWDTFWVIKGKGWGYFHFRIQRLFLHIMLQIRTYHWVFYPCATPQNQQYPKDSIS